MRRRSLVPPIYHLTSPMKCLLFRKKCFNVDYRKVDIPDSEALGRVLARFVTRRTKRASLAVPCIWTRVVLRNREGSVEGMSYDRLGTTVACVEAS